MLKEFTVGLDIAGVATRTVPLLLWPGPGRGEKMTIEAATFVQETDTDGAKTVKIRNRTKARDLTANLTIDTLAAQSSAAFVLSTGVNKDVEPSDQLELVYTVNTAGAVGPGSCVVYMRFRSGPSGSFIGG